MSVAAGSSIEDTLALIKPNAYGKKSEIQQIILNQKFEIVESFDLELQRSDAEAFYAEHKDRPFFGELVDFMTSGTITAMKLRRTGAIAAWRLCMGPTNFEEARKQVPNSIRALYGESMTANASHGSDSAESAARELEFFFGDGGVISKSMTDTLALIKPNAYDKRTEIESIIQDNGFEIVKSYDLQLQRSDAESFYAEHKERPFFGELVDFMTSGRIVALKLRRCNAIAAWRALMGPTNFETAKAEAPGSIRALYGESMTANASHGSDSAESSARELDFFFGVSGVVTKQLENTLALVKPNAFAKRDEIKAIILRYGFEIVEAYDLTLARSDAEAFYAEHKDRPFFGELVDFMVSGQITAMKLRKCGAIKEWRSLMGPTNHETAKAEAPGSIRALYGESMTANASHGSDSLESAAREVAFFFGEGGVIDRTFEDTLALIKPNAFGKRAQIQQLITENGFVIAQSAELQLTQEQAQEFYAEHSGRGFFGELVEFMTSGKIVAMRLRKEGAILAWRTLMGPTNFETAKAEAPGSIRALYGESMTANASHGSDAPESAARELDFFFGENGVTQPPLQDTLALIKPNAFGKRAEIQQLIVDNGFIIAESQELQLTKEQAEEFYAEHSGRGFFGELVEFMTSGQIVAMRLRKEDAIPAWRALMGPTNFETAKAEAPGSIRALYGESMTANASHGSDAVESAQRELDFFFGAAGIASNAGWIDISGDGGILKKVLKEGKGGFPGEGANVFAHYVGTLTANGEKFDSSRDRGSPFNFPIGQGRVIRGWDEGIATMRKGELCILRCRSDYAYGDQATGNIPAGASLDFEVELLSFDLYSDLETGLKWRKIVRASEDEYETPNEYDTAIVSLIGMLYDEEKDLGAEEAAEFAAGEDAVVFSKGEQIEFIVGDMDESTYPLGLDKAIQNMMVGEDCVFVVTAPLGFGPEGNSDLGVPAGNAPLQYRVKLHQIRSAQTKYDMSGVEILQLCEQLKKEGNDFFSAGNYPKALKRYSRIVDSFLDDFDEDDKFESKDEARDLIIKVRNNLALIKYKVRDYSECLAECDQILEIEAGNVKAMVRRAQALIQLGNNSEAKRQLKSALALDPENEAIPRLLKINAKKIKAQKQKEIDLAKRMFSRPMSGKKKKKTASADSSSDAKEECEPSDEANPAAAPV